MIGALYIDVRNRLVGERELYRGTLHRAGTRSSAALVGRIDAPETPACR